MQNIYGSPSFTGGNALIGQGLLVVDTTQGGTVPGGGTVTISGGSKYPADFRGLIYIKGNLQIKGNVEIQGAIIVDSPNENARVEIGGSGFIRFSEPEVSKSIIDIPFALEIRSREMKRFPLGQKALVGDDTK